MKIPPLIPFVCSIALILLSTLACSISLGGPQAPTEEPTAITESTAIPVQPIQTTVPDNGSGLEFSAQFTDAQLTDYLKEQLSTQSDPLLQDPKVVLKDGQIEVYGVAQRGILTGNVRIVATVSIDEQGQPKLKILSANIGAVPIPGSVLDIFASSLQDALIAKLSPGGTGLKLEEIKITEGLMTVKGRLP